MRKLFAAGIIVAITTLGMAVSAVSAFAAHPGGEPVPDSARDIVSCEPGGGPGYVLPGVLGGSAPQLPQNPGVGAGGINVLGTENPCANIERTIVFVGDASITNGVNFAGTGTGGLGGNYEFTGLCVMVSYANPGESAVPTLGQAPSVSDCAFDTTGGSGRGTYTKPTSVNPVTGPIGAAIGTVLGVAHPGASPWDPATQAGCLDSDGSGAQTFKTTGLDGSVETWASVGNFSWQNGLSNLRGTIHGTDVNTNTSLGSYPFDAKIHGDVDTAAALLSNVTPGNTPTGQHVAVTPPADQWDLTQAGCLEKTVQELTGDTGTLTSGANSPNNGLNYILVVGTSSWETTVPKLFP